VYELPGWAKLNGANAVSFVVVKHVLENFPNGASNASGCEKNHDFQPISRFISEMMQDIAIVSMEGK